MLGAITVRWRTEVCRGNPLPSLARGRNDFGPEEHVKVIYSTGKGPLSAGLGVGGYKSLQRGTSPAASQIFY